MHTNNPSIHTQFFLFPTVALCPVVFKLGSCQTTHILIGTLGLFTCVTR